MATGLTGSFSALPGARSASEVALEALRYVGLPDDQDARSQAQASIRAAIRQVNTRTWRWSFSRSDITLVTGQFDYSIARDMNAPVNLERQNADGNPDGLLAYKPPEQFFKEHSRSTVNGQPRVYTFLDYHTSGKLTLDKAPDQSFVTTYPTLRLWYTRFVLFPYPGEGLNVPSNIEHFIDAYTKWDLASQHARDRVDQAERNWRSIWQEIVKWDNSQVDWTE